MKIFTKTLVAAALLAGTGAASASIATGSNTLSEAYLSVYNSGGTKTFNLDLGLLMGDLVTNISNSAFTRTYDLTALTASSTGAKWSDFAASLTGNTTWGVLVNGTSGRSMATSASVPNKFATTPLAVTSVTALTNFANRVNNDAVSDNAGATLGDNASNLSSIILDSESLSGQHNLPNTFNDLFGTNSSAQADIAYGQTGDFYYYLAGTSITKAAYQIKLEGNMLTFGLIIDPPPPPYDYDSPTVSSFSPVDNATGVNASANLILTFSEPIQKGIGTIQIHTGSAAGPVLESFAVASSANLTITNSNTLTIDPTANLSPSTHYFVTLDAGSVNDLAGNAYAGSISYDFTTAAAPFNVTENVTFWKTGAALSGATSSLVATNTTPPVEFRNLQIAADGSRSFEIWETSTGTNSLQLKVALPDGAIGTWQDAAGLVNDWSSLANTEISGQFGLAGIGLTALADGPVKLGTLTMHSPNPFTSFDLSLITGSLGTQAVAPFSITPDITNLSINGLYQHIDIAGGSYQLNTAKSALSIGNAIQADDALAVLKMAVGLTPNTDSSAASPFQFLAADVNRDGKVSAADALNVLKMALDLSTAPEKNWFFMPDVVGSESMTRTTVNWSDTVNPLTVDHTQTVHLIGVVSGDVNGSWVEPVIV
jgi:methionine-rich copper-binding protein CopC